jgi:hypothetical protein
MTDKPAPRRIAAFTIWLSLALALSVPVAIAATNPFLEGRNFAYLLAGFAGIICLALFLVQPLLAAGYLPSLQGPKGRKWHRRLGWAIVLAVLLHVGGLYITSPPDTIDALLLVSPTPFSVYGVIAMWGVIVTAFLAALRGRLGLGYVNWKILHNTLVFTVIVATVIHALQIEGTMGSASKWALCVGVLIASGATLLDLWLFKPLIRRRARARRLALE